MGPPEHLTEEEDTDLSHILRHHALSDLREVPVKVPEFVWRVWNESIPHGWRGKVLASLMFEAARTHTMLGGEDALIASHFLWAIHQGRFLFKPQKLSDLHSWEESLKMILSNDLRDEWEWDDTFKELLSGKTEEPELEEGGEPPKD